MGGLVHAYSESVTQAVELVKPAAQAVPGDRVKAWEAWLNVEREAPPGRVRVDQCFGENVVERLEFTLHVVCVVPDGVG